MKTFFNLILVIFTGMVLGGIMAFMGGVKPFTGDFSSAMAIGAVASFIVRALLFMAGI